jgi:hypothetical protein
VGVLGEGWLSDGASVAANGWSSGDVELVPHARTASSKQVDTNVMNFEARDLSTGRSARRAADMLEESILILPFHRKAICAHDYR